MDFPALATAGLHVLPQFAVPAKAARRTVQKAGRRQFARLEQYSRAVDVLNPLPEVGEVLHGVTCGAFSGWCLASAAVELLGAVESMTVATLGFNRENCRDLCELVDAGKVGSVLLLVSDYFKSSDRDVFADCRRELEHRGQRVAIARAHAKLILIKTASRNIVIETSANLRSSMNWEQFTISDSVEVLDFHERWISDLIESDL